MILTAVGQSCRPFRSGPTHVFLTVWVPGKLLLMSRMRRSGFLIKDRLMLSSISWDGVMLEAPAKYWSIMAVRASVLARASFMSSSLLNVPSRSVTAMTTGPRTSADNDWSVAEFIAAIRHMSRMLAMVEFAYIT